MKKPPAPFGMMAHPAVKYLSVFVLRIAQGWVHSPAWVLITSKDCSGHTGLKNLFKVIPKQIFMHRKEKA